MAFVFTGLFVLVGFRLSFICNKHQANVHLVWISVLHSAVGYSISEHSDFERTEGQMANFAF